MELNLLRSITVCMNTHETPCNCQEAELCGIFSLKLYYSDQCESCLPGCLYAWSNQLKLWGANFILFQFFKEDGWYNFVISFYEGQPSASSDSSGQSGASAGHCVQVLLCSQQAESIFAVCTDENGKFDLSLLELSCSWGSPAVLSFISTAPVSLMVFLNCFWILSW